jgi:hypothetical protein
MNKTLAAAITAAVSLALLVAGTGNAQAKDPEKVFKGQIITATKRIPSSSKSANAYIATLKKLRTSRFFENKQKKAWKVHYAAFFRKPLNDL